MTKDLLRMALDALKKYDAPSTDIMGRPCRRPIDDRLCNDIMSYLAQPQAEPVAHLYDDGTWIATQTAAGRSLSDRMLFAGSPKIGVYTHPAAPAPAVPYAWHYTNNGGASVWHMGPSNKLDADIKAAAEFPRAHKITAVYAAPPSPPPVALTPLTDKQICKALGIDGSDDWTYTVARAIEQAHGITAKGTP